MSMFTEVLGNVSDVEEKLLGPSYPYYKNIKPPGAIGISDKGTMAALGKDISGLIQYTNVLVSGTSTASATGGPLGNKFFMETGAKCNDPSGNQQTRYIYVDNVPDGSIPLISSIGGQNFSDFRGLIPGTMSNLEVLNPFTIMQAFMSGTTPACQNLTMETIDANNNKSVETHYVTTIDIQNMNPCTFRTGQNTVTGQKCKMSFANMTPAAYATTKEPLMLPKDNITQIYFAGLAGIGVYVLYKVMLK